MPGVINKLGMEGFLRRRLFTIPRRLTDVDPWHEHIPFAFLCVELLSPGTFVELGVYGGDSYCAFCQAVDELGLPTCCYGFATWLGNAHAGGDEENGVLADLKDHHDPLYGRFSRLVRHTFDEPQAYFADGTIDLLHINGLHTYDAVRHDFETWLPKLSDRAVVLFHDINIREKEFGVWRFWEEIRGGRPSLAIAHGHGLGVVAVGTHVPPLFLDFLKSAAEPGSLIPSVLFALGNRIALLGRTHHAETQLARARAECRVRETELDQLRPELTERRAELAGLRAQVKQYEADLARLRDSVTPKPNPVPLPARTPARRSQATGRRRHVMFLEGNGNVVWENGRYRSTGGRAQFRLISPVGRAPGGWVVISYRGSTNRSPLRLLLRAEPVAGIGVDIPLPASDGQPISTLIRLPDQVASLTLEPTNAPDVYTIEGFAIQEIPRRNARARIALHYLRRVLREPRAVPALTRHALDVWRHAGLAGLKERLLLASGVPSPTGALPLSRPVLTSPDRPSTQPRPAAALTYCPLVSVIMPVYNVDPEYLRSAVRSVERQTYGNWELCVCDDGSTNPLTLQTLEALASGNPRIKVSLGSHRGISIATNEALARAQGDYVAFLDHDDELALDALFEYVAALNEKADIDVLYSDQDKIDTAGRSSEPFFKPDWSPELLRGVMYVGHLLMVRRSLLAEVGGLDSTYDGVQDFDLMLRLSERTDRIHHVRAILYHWRRLPGSIAATADAKPDAGGRQVAAVNAHLQRTGVLATAKPHPVLPHRVILQPTPRATAWPPVSIIIPTKDAPAWIGRCLDSLFSLTTYADFEVIIVDNGSTDADAKAILSGYPVTIVPFTEPFSFSRANNLGVAHARGSYVVLLNNDTEVLDSEWLQTLVFHIELPTVGIVGPLLLYPDRSVQHAGVALGLRGTADHVMRRFPADADGYAGSLCCTREVMAVTAACLMTGRQHYLDIGGLNEYYKTHYQDVDFCLRSRRRGLRTLYTPGTKLIHHESVTRGKFYDLLDRALLLDAWGDVIARGDPFHDPRVPGYSE